MTIRGRHPYYLDLTKDLEPGDAGSALPDMTVGGMLRSNRAARAVPNTSHLRPNFEGIGEDEDPDAYDRMKDRRLGG